MSDPRHRLPFALPLVAILISAAFANLLDNVARAEGPGADTEVRVMNWVGFQQMQEASRVFVRTSDTVNYRVDTSREGVVVLVLENTRVPLRNNTRMLDTHFFDGPVLYIQPKIIEDTSPSVRIEIHLRKKVAFKETKSENTLALDFERS